MTIETDPATLAVHFGSALEAARVPYAIGGAVAYGFWGVPRGTRDLDINLFVGADAGAAALAALIAAGLEIDTSAALRSGAERGDARGSYAGVPVDLFFISIPLHESAAQRTSTAPLLGSTIRILSAEDLTIFTRSAPRFPPSDRDDAREPVSARGRRSG